MREDLAALCPLFNGAGYAQFLDMHVLDLGDGYSKIGMVVKPWHRSWSGGVHKGVIMSLADQAFGTATNTLGQTHHHVALQFAISFLADAKEGELLTAEGRIVSLESGHGAATIVVRGEDGRLLAEAHGTVLTVSN